MRQQAPLLGQRRADLGSGSDGRRRLSGRCRGEKGVGTRSRGLRRAGRCEKKNPAKETCVNASQTSGQRGGGRR